MGANTPHELFRSYTDNYCTDQQCVWLEALMKEFIFLQLGDRTAVLQVEM